MKAIVLDRDGVINYDSIDYIKTPEQWHALPGSLEAIARLNQLGYQVFVATNQSGIARGFYDHDGLKQIHLKMLTALSNVGGKITDIVYCPHGPDDGCTCRKPQPGLLLQLSEKYLIDWNKTPFVGDSLKDILAAQKVGAQPVLVKTGNGQQTLLDNPYLVSELPIYDSLADMVENNYEA